MTLSLFDVPDSPAPAPVRRAPAPAPAPAPDRREAQAHRDAGATETEARDRIMRISGTLRADVLVAAVDRGEQGLTATEATEAIGRRLDQLYSVAPRLTELVASGHMVIDGRRGRRQVYVPTATGRAWVAEHK